jgi:protocatechuate 3,4-dioxygenase beta subunit
MSRLNFAFLLLILVPTLQRGPAAQSTVKSEKRQTATVSGQVILNGEPLSGVTVRLFPERMAVSGDPRSPVEAVTDEHGNYRVTGIVAGSYQVGVLPNEFLITGGPTSRLQTKMVSVSEGEKVEGFDLVLKRGGAITGRVTDSSGRPLSRLAIHLTRIGDDGKPQPFPFNHPGLRMTDEEGVYRITRLPDGRYLVSAGITETEKMGTQIPRAVHYPETFHPDVSDPSGARSVEITEGAEITGIDILIAETLKTFDIKGRVVKAETGEPVEGIEIFYMLYREGSGTAAPRAGHARSNSDGEFVFQSVLPGKYAIYPQVGGEREYFSEPAICEITDDGIDGVEVKLQQGGSISGTVVIEGAKDPAVMAKLSQINISGFSKDQKPPVIPREAARISADGSFRIPGLRPGRIYFSLGGNPKSGNFVIRRIERNGTLAQDGIEVGPGENLSNVRLIVGHGDITLRGEVKVISGFLPPHIGIYVNLYRKSESESGFHLGVDLDSRGQFMFQNLVPGDYEIRLISINFQRGEPLDKALTKLIYNTRQKVTIGADSQPTITIVIDLSQKERIN